MRASSRNEAIHAFKEWTSIAYLLYMRTEAMSAGDNRPHGSKGTIADPEYLKALNEADLSIKTAFREAEHEEFNMKNAT